MPRLDARLKAVAAQIRCHTHVDIGSDHGHLLKALLAAGRIEHGIAIENKTQPHANSMATLAGYNADVRLGDGLAALSENEGDCLSICGMGGPSIARILGAYPQRVPATVIVQPNNKPELVRDWGRPAGYALVDETIAFGHWRYVILRFERSDDDDPAYEGIDREAARLFGPTLIRAWDEEFVASLQEELVYLRSLDRLGCERSRRLAIIERLLD